MQGKREMNCKFAKHNLLTSGKVPVRLNFCIPKRRKKRWLRVLHCLLINSTGKDSIITDAYFYMDYIIYDTKNYFRSTNRS